MSSDCYPFGPIEAKCQRRWESRRRFRATEDPRRPNHYCHEKFRYSAGRNHMGNVRVYAIRDALARCWRCDSEVTQREIDGWFFKITKYADELLEWCERLPGWPERVMTMQRNWIGRSEGAEFDLPVVGRPGLAVRVFTTRPDTSFGMTYAVLAPEHPLVDQLVADGGERAAVERF